MTTRTERVQSLGDRLSQYLSEIEALYADDVVLTLIVRNPSFPDGRRDTVMTSDPDIEAAINALRSLWSDPRSERYPI
jgi:hypothetical protein